MKITALWMQNRFKGDPIIWGVAFLLSILSILVVYSATSSLAYRHMQGDTEYYLIKHVSLMLLSLTAMWVAHNIDYRYYGGIARLGLWCSVPLLMITWQYGLKLNEASRWLMIPVINKAFQPGDIAQLTLIIRTVHTLAKLQKKSDEDSQTLLTLMLWISTICALIALTNFSGAIVLFVTCMLLMFLGRVPTRYLARLSLAGLLMGIVAMGVGQRGKTVLHRLQAFRQEKLSYQTEQAYIAIATGGMYGKGPGKSTQRNFLPHPYSDFIYAILVEEYGLIGGIGVILLYLVLLYRSIGCLGKTQRIYGGLLAAGLGFYLTLQAMIHISVAVGLGPVTGLTLPFVSMGGTSLLFTGISLGIILSVSRGELDPSIDRLGQKRRRLNRWRNG